MGMAFSRVLAPSPSGPASMAFIQSGFGRSGLSSGVQNQATPKPAASRPNTIAQMAQPNAIDTRQTTAYTAANWESRRFFCAAVRSDHGSWLATLPVYASGTGSSGQREPGNTKCAVTFLGWTEPAPIGRPDHPEPDYPGASGRAEPVAQFAPSFAGRLFD